HKKGAGTMSPNMILLEARLRQELENLTGLLAEAKSVTGISQPRLHSLRQRAAASILHDFYSGIEKMFLNIAREVDQATPRSETWHRDLLEQMTLAIPHKRPPVIDRSLAARLQEYLSFRHRFRNLYGFELNWVKMEHLLLNMEDTLREWQKQLEEFLQLLNYLDE
ncbi:MAG: hypothetical protein ACOY81_10070, partial [Bacillota bacterium]